jgi:hypothetical protein
MRKLDPKFTDIDLDDVKIIAESLKQGDFNFVKNEALTNWLSDLKGESNLSTAQAWTIAVLSVLSARGFEVRKK